MHVKRAIISMVLLAPAITGCHFTPSRQTTSPWSEAAQAADRLMDAPGSFPEKVASRGTTLASHQQAKPLVAPVLYNHHPEKLTLADLETIALENNPTLVTAAAKVEAARGRHLQAGLYPNPVVGYHTTEAGNLGTAGQQGGFINQRIITAGKLGLDQAIADKEIDQAHFLFHAQEQRVMSDLKVRFYDSLAAQQRVELTKELAHIGDKLVTMSERLLDSRLISENILLQAEIEAEQSYILYENAQNENIEAWRRLTAITGLPMMSFTPLAGSLVQDLPSYDWEECYTMILDRNPQLDAARTEVERARIAIERAHQENIPNVDVSVSVRHHNVTHSDVANIQVGIPLPLFDRNQGNIMRREADLIATQKNVSRLELDLQDRLAVAYRRYVNARQQARRYKSRILDRAQKSLDLVSSGYEEGQVDYQTLLTTQKTFVHVNLAYLEATRELRGSLAMIEGQLLSGSLSQR